MVGTCNTHCQNSICIKCDEEDKHPSSQCQCKIGEFFNKDSNQCLKCDQQCESCYNSQSRCASCPFDRSLNLMLNICECNKHLEYSDFGNGGICKECYYYGSTCVESCPEDTTADDTRDCVSDTDIDSQNDEDLLFVIAVTVSSIVSTILLITLFIYFQKSIIRLVIKIKTRILPLSQDEDFYIANKLEMNRLNYYKNINDEAEELKKQERKRQKELEEEEHRRRMKELEEKIKKEAEEQKRLEQMIEQRKKLEEEENRRRIIEEEQRRIMEEELRKKRALEEKLRQMELAEQERRLAEQQAKKKELEMWLKRKRIEEEYADKEREDELMSDQRRMQLEAQRLEEEAQKQQFDQEEIERKELLKAVREKRRLRQQQRQKEINAIQILNDKKIENMRENRNKIIQEKENMEDYNEDCKKKAKEIEQELIAIKSELQASIEERESIQNKKIELNDRQKRIEEERQQLDEQLQGINFSSAQDKLQKLSAKDITFLQNLRQPPERIRVCLEALVIVLKNSTKKIPWEQIKKEICSPVFRKTLYFYDLNKIQDKVFNKIIKEYTCHPEWDIEKISKASVAAGIFAEWIEGIIQFKETKDQNLPLFEKMKDLKQEELEIAEEYEQLDDLLFKSRQLEEEEYALELQIKELEESQKKFIQNATENLDQIEEKEEEINNINTNDLTLEEIEDDGNESEIDSNIDIQDLRLLEIQ